MVQGSSVERDHRQRREEWDDAQRSVLFRQIVSGELSVAVACQRHGLGLGQLLEWLRDFRRAALLAFNEQLERRLIAQGAPADALGGAQVVGTLQDISLADLAQLIQLTGKSAVITVRHDGVDSRLWCADGAIVDAESGRCSGEAAAYRILALEHGQVVADLRAEPRRRSIDLPMPVLLLEAARRKDEAQRLRDQIGDERRCFRLDARAKAALAGLSPAELAALEYFEPVRSLGEMLEQAELDELSTLQVLSRLIEAGLLMEVDPPAAPLAEPAPAADASHEALLESFFSNGPGWRPRRTGKPRWSLDAVSNLLLPAASWLGSKVTLRPKAAPPLHAGERPLYVSSGRS